MVGTPGDSCNKCGHQHNQNARDAEVGIFNFKKEDKKD